MISTSQTAKLYSLTCFYIQPIIQPAELLNQRHAQNFRRNTLIHNHIHKYELVMEIQEIFIIDLSIKMQS